MSRKLSFLFGLCFVIGACFVSGASASEAKPKIMMVPTCEASSPYELFEAKKEVGDFLDVNLFSAGLGVLPSAEGVDMTAYDLVFIVGNSYETIKLKDAVERAKKKTKVVVVSPVLLEGNVDLDAHPDIGKYYFNRSKENFRRLMVYLGVHFCGLDKKVEKPVIFPDAGIYHPDAPGLFTDPKRYFGWYEKKVAGRHVYDSDKLTIGILFYKTDYTKKNLKVLDALIRSSEKKGCNVVALYARGGKRLSGLLTQNDKPFVDVLVSLSDQLNWASREKGIGEARKVNVPILYAPVHYYLRPSEWEKDMSGLGADMASQLTYSELNGMFEPIVIGGKALDKKGKKYKEPIDYQIEWRVDRAISWARLHRMDNAEKKVAIMYYSEGGGKGNVGADIDYYLDAQASLVNMFEAMSQRGYDLGPRPVFDKEVLSSMMAEQGSNIGVWNRPEIRKRVKEGSAELVAYETYLSWFKELDDEQREAVIEKWGQPPGNIMTYEEAGKKYIVIPKIEFGNIVLLPHPTWGLMQDKSVLYSREGVPPHHQYIAFWFWVNREFKANAVISIFTQISLMPGKQRGLSKHDWGGVLLQNVPNIHPFPVQANGGLHNKRRANALVIDYMPTIVSSDLYEELLDLKNKVSLYERSQEKALKSGYAEGIVDEVKRLKLYKELQVNVDTLSTEALIDAVNTYLDEINREHMPYGPHILSEPPRGEALVDMVLSMLGSDFRKHVKRLGVGEEASKTMIKGVVLQGMALDEIQKKILGQIDTAMTTELERAIYYRDKINGCSDEIPRILDALEGQYILPGPMDDPIRNPEALPTGRNPQGMDARAFPTKEAWETGKSMVNQMLHQHRDKTGEYPKKVAFVLWSSETTKNHGVSEAQILYLLGIKPIWGKGRVKDVELMEHSELKRPRIDVVITASGLYRDHFQEKIGLLDKAVRLAAEQKEEDNYVRDNTYFIEKELLRAGYAKEDARAVSTARIFSEAIGAYSPAIQFAVAAGDTWKDEREISDLYMRRVSHMYGEHVKGKNAKEVFARNLQNVDAGMFSRSSNVYGVLEHPMVAAYFGGLKMAVRNTSGTNIEMYITNLRDADDAKVETLERFYNRELRSRYFNPKWIKGMMEHGYDGARYMETFTENMWVWDVTSPDMVTEENWNEVYHVYVEDKYDLDMQKYFDENNPYALQSMVSTMLEVREKGYWQPSKEVFENLVKVYAESVARHGISGGYGSTDDVMHKDITDVLKNMQDVPPELLEEYQDHVRQYSGKLEQVKGYEVKEVKHDIVDKERFRLQIGFFILLVSLTLIGLGWWRGKKSW